MKTSSLRERVREELRRTILESAREAFLEEGYEAVSMRRLAESVGCSHGNLYFHFRDKDALFDAIVEDSFAQLAESLRGINARGTDPVAAAKRGAWAYVEWGLQNPGAYEFAFLLRRPDAPARTKPHAAYELMRSLVKRCIGEGRFRRMNVDVASQALWAAVHGITALLVSRPSFPWADREAVIRRVIDSAVEGLLKRDR